MIVRGFRGPIPEQLTWLNAINAGRSWLAALPQTVDKCAAKWRLELGEPFPYAYTSIAIPVRREDGSDAVLKVRYIDRETEDEPVALHEWNGNGAILLIDEIPRLGAMLLERCIPGTPLSDAGSDVALEVLTGLLPRLWVRPTRRFRSLADEAADWEASLRKRRQDREVEAALDALRNLPRTQGDPVLLHQDLHAGNVLAARREPWLVIDPKPLVGEREFGLAPIIRSSELGYSRRDVIRRLDQLSSDLSLDRERARLWCIAQTVAWSTEGDENETVSWLLQA